MTHLASMNCRAVILWSTNADIWRPQIVIPGSRDMHCRVNTALTRQYLPITGHLNCISYPQINMDGTLSVTSKMFQEHEWVRGLCQAIIRSDKHHYYCHSSSPTLLWGKRLIKSMTEVLKFRGSISLSTANIYHFVFAFVLSFSCHSGSICNTKYSETKTEANFLNWNFFERPNFL